MHEAHTAPGHGLVRTAREIALLESDRLEHAACQRDVLGLSAMRGTRERELLVAPPARIETARFDERQRLERFGARAPYGEERRVARAPEDVTLGASDYCVDVMPGLDRATAGCHDIELITVR